MSDDIFQPSYPLYAPCPFCGSRDVLDVQADMEVMKETDYLHVTKCDSCGAVGPPRDSLDDAAAAWNIRTAVGIGYGVGRT